jgi:hypothetical protein
MYQLLDGCFVGLIASAWQREGPGGAEANSLQLTAFQAASEGGGAGGGEAGLAGAVGGGRGRGGAVCAG